MIIQWRTDEFNSATRANASSVPFWWTNGAIMRHSCGWSWVRWSLIGNLNRNIKRNIVFMSIQLFTFLTLVEDTKAWCFWLVLHSCRWTSWSLCVSNILPHPLHSNRLDLSNDFVFSFSIDFSFSFSSTNSYEHEILHGKIKVIFYEKENE